MTHPNSITAETDVGFGADMDDGLEKVAESISDQGLGAEQDAVALGGLKTTVSQADISRYLRQIQAMNAYGRIA